MPANDSSKVSTPRATAAAVKSREEELRAAARRVQLSEEPFITVRDFFRVLGAIILASTLSSWIWTSGQSVIWGAPQPWWTKPAAIQAYFKAPLLLTNEQLAAYDGSDPSKPILLALNRTIYDVSSSPKVYGVGGMYSTLAAKDATRSYITTCFDPQDDLVPYLGGVEEVFVPLWLAKKPQKKELDEIAKGEVLNGMGVGDLLDKVKQRIGLRKTRKMQEEAYAKARERVAAQIKSWESMFDKKGYPVVGRVVGVVEDDPKLWKKLKFCDKALKQRPSLADSMGDAMKAITGSDKIDIGKMKGYIKQGKKAAGLDVGEDETDDERAASEAAAAAVAGDASKDEGDLRDNADESIAEMMKKGKYAPDSKEQVKKEQQRKGKEEL